MDLFRAIGCISVEFCGNLDESVFSFFFLMSWLLELMYAVLSLYFMCIFFFRFLRSWVILIEAEGVVAVCLYTNLLIILTHGVV